LRQALLVLLSVFVVLGPARAAEDAAVSPFIAHIANLAVYVRAAPICGVRTTRWSRDLFDSIVAIVEQTRDGNAAHRPSSEDVMAAMNRVSDAHRTGETIAQLNPSSTCVNARRSEGLRRADALVQRHRDRRLHSLGREFSL
jgi:hypothetical protein